MSLIEYWSFSWDSKLYLYTDHILISYTFSSQKIEWKDVQKIEKTKNSVIINNVEMAGFTTGLIDGIYQILIDIYNKKGSGLLFKVNSSLYTPANFSYSKTALVLWRNGKIEKCFPFQNLQFIIFEKPYHFKLQDHQFEVEFFHYSPLPILKEFLQLCPKIKVDISCTIDTQIEELFKSGREKNTRSSTSMRSIGNNKLEHPTMERPRRKKKVPVQKNEGSSYEWVFIDDVPEEYNLFDLETLMDCPFKKWMKFGKKSYLCNVKARKVKELSPIKIPSPIKPMKKMDYEYIFSKLLEQYYLQLHDTVTIGEAKATVEWIGHEDDHVWIGLEYDKGDTVGVFRGKKRFQCKSNSLFVTLDHFQYQKDVDWQKKKVKPGLFDLFKKKKERTGFPVYIGEKKKKGSTKPTPPKQEDKDKSPDSSRSDEKVEKKVEEPRVNGTKVAEVIENVVKVDVEPPLIEMPRTDIKINEDEKTDIFAVDKNTKETNITDFTNLTRARRKKNVRAVVKAEVSDLIQETKSDE